MGTIKRKEPLKTMDQIPEHIKQANSELVSSIKGKLEAISSLRSIFRVPEEIRRQRENFQDLYCPVKVSIGPIHHNPHSEELKEMEEQKWHYMYTLLSRKPDLEASLHECVKALKETEQTARNYYAKDITLPAGDKFVEMMLLDGCFIIELFLKYIIKGLRQRGDPIFSTKGVLSTMRCDLILLENQMPFVILQRLFEIVPIPIQCSQSLSELSFRFFRNMLPGDRQFLSEKFSQEGNHILDLIRHCYLPTYPRERSKTAASPSPEGDEYCATKLLKSGVKFMRFTAKSLLDIKFDNGLVEIAPLKMHKFTKKLFANLIALEQHETHVQHFTCYALLMKAFIHGDKDENLFRHLRILIDDKDHKVDDEEHKENFRELFEKLCEGVRVKEFYYAGILTQIDEYKRSRKRWMQMLKCHCITIST